MGVCDRHFKQSQTTPARYPREVMPANRKKAARLLLGRS